MASRAGDDDPIEGGVGPADAASKQMRSGFLPVSGGISVDPNIPLMDEPFSALDPLVRRGKTDS